MIIRFFTLLLIASVFLSCKNEANKDASSSSYSKDDGLITMRGEFIFIENAAVLQTSANIYGVVVDDKMNELYTAVKPYQISPTDMVPVTVRVLKFEKPTNEEGWPYRVEIKEIIKVESPDLNKNDVIKLVE